MRHHLYLDVPGLRGAARRSLFAPEGDAWRIDLGRLCAFVSDKAPVVSPVILCGGAPVAEDSLAEVLREAGLGVRILGLPSGQDEVQVLENEVRSDSTEILVPGRDAVSLVCGDDRLVPLVESLRSRGIPVHAFFFVQGSSGLRRAATVFWGLDGWLPWLLPQDHREALPAPALPSAR